MEVVEVVPTRDAGRVQLIAVMIFRSRAPVP